MTIYDKLTDVQSKLKVPKSQFNKFGGYSYRSCEDILEAVKPLLEAHKLCLTISDDIESVGDRIYVKATVRLIDNEGKSAIETTARAREENEQKGMVAPQITGTASSYARKYALNGLFAIDDTKDADATNNGDVKKPKEAPKTELKDTIDNIIALCNELGGTKNEAMMTVLKGYARNGNPNYIKDADKATELLEKLTNMKKGR